MGTKDDFKAPMVKTHVFWEKCPNLAKKFGFTAWKQDENNLIEFPMTFKRESAKLSSFFLGNAEIIGGEMVETKEYLVNYVLNDEQQGAPFIETHAFKHIGFTMNSKSRLRYVVGYKPEKDCTGGSGTGLKECEFQFLEVDNDYGYVTDLNDNTIHADSNCFGAVSLTIDPASTSDTVLVKKSPDLGQKKEAQCTGINMFEDTDIPDRRAFLEELKAARASGLDPSKKSFQHNKDVVKKFGIKDASHLKEKMQKLKDEMDAQA